VCSKALGLLIIGDQHSCFGFSLYRQIQQACHANDLVLPGYGILTICHQDEFSLRVGMTNAHQPLMRGALFKAERVEIAHVHGIFRQATVELHHQRFVFGANGPNRDFCSIAQDNGGSRRYRIARI